MAVQYPLLFVLLVTAAGSTAPATIAGLALYRLRSLSYFLVTIAMGTLLLRSILGAVSMGGMVSMHPHHGREEAVIAHRAVIMPRPARKRSTAREPYTRS